MLIISILFLPIFASALVVKSEEDAGLYTEFLLGHAEVVSISKHKGNWPEVEDKVQILRYFVQLSLDTRKTFLGLQAPRS